MDGLARPGSQIGLKGRPCMADPLLPGHDGRLVPQPGAGPCVDGRGEDGDLPRIQVDDGEFTWDEFGRMLLTYPGWGMRIVFVPDDELDRTPKTIVREPDR